MTHHANTERPDRCFVEMYKQYCLHGPTDVKDDAFNLAPLCERAGVVLKKGYWCTYTCCNSQTFVCKGRDKWLQNKPFP